MILSETGRGGEEDVREVQVSDDTIRDWPRRKRKMLEKYR
jgi:hypothetical protein